MARSAGAPSTVLIDEFDFSGRTNQLSIDFTNNLGEVTAFSDDGSEYVEGLFGVQASLNGFFDGAASNFDAEMWTILGDGQDHAVGLYPGNSATSGSIGYELQGASVLSQERPAEVAGAILLNASFQNSGTVIRSTVLDNQAVTTTGTVSGSNQNIGSTASGERFVAIIRVVAWNASSLTVNIQESTDDGSGDAYVDIAGFSEVFSGLGTARLQTTSATEAWKRISLSTFSGTSATVFVAVGKDHGVS